MIMDLFSLVGLIIVVIVLLSVGKVLSMFLRLTFYALLAVLFLVFVFGISFSEVVMWLQDLVLLSF